MKNFIFDRFYLYYLFIFNIFSKSKGTSKQALPDPTSWSISRIFFALGKQLIGAVTCFNLVLYFFVGASLLFNFIIHAHCRYDVTFTRHDSATKVDQFGRNRKSWQVFGKIGVKWDSSAFFGNSFTESCEKDGTEVYFSCYLYIQYRNDMKTNSNEIENCRKQSCNFFDFQNLQIIVSSNFYPNLSHSRKT